MADRVGTQLGNYRLVRLLGQGGFAEVYLGQHIYLDTEAAIKVLHTRLSSEDEEQFRDEARTIARLVHPNIVRVLEYNVQESTPYLVVDYAPNGTLRKRHPRGVPLPLTTVVSYVSQVAEALQYAHEQKVVHRDVKPENMLLGRRNEVLLSDFGIALVTQSSRYNSLQGVQGMAGTIAYMAPEQIESQACPNSDQYSLAIVVYEWLSGERPFQGSFAEIAVKQTMATPLSLRQKVPSLSPAVEAVVMKALAKEPQNRYPTIRDFATALRLASTRTAAASSSIVTDASTPVPGSQLPSPAETALLSVGEAPAEESFETVPSLPPLPSPHTSLLKENPPPSVGPPAVKQLGTTSMLVHVQRRGISRRSVVLGLAGVAAAAVVGGGVVTWLTHVHAPQSVSNSTLKPAALIYTFTGHTDWVWSAAWSPNGKRIASVSNDETAQVWDATTGDNLNIYRGHSDTVYGVAWSIDGRRIASASFDKTVQVWDDPFSDHLYTYHGHTSWVWAVAWSPDGSRIASAGGDKTVQVWNPASASPAAVYHAHTAPVYAVAWSPDGGRIASAGGDGTVRIWDSASGNLLKTFTLYSVLNPDYPTVWSVTWSPDGGRLASASNDSIVQVLDATNGEQVFTYRGHSGPIHDVAWSPDGRHIASASGDKTVQVWDAASGRHIYTYTGHTNSVRSVGWSFDNERLASSSWDKTVQVWRTL